MSLDYLIIGAGPSGLIIHKELSTLQKGIVLESGGEIKTKKENLYSKYQIKNAYRYSGLNVLLGNHLFCLAKEKLLVEVVLLIAHYIIELQIMFGQNGKHTTVSKVLAHSI